MNHINNTSSPKKYRTTIARKVKDLRRARQWTQAELARSLQLSQSRLSEIEGGDGSFTAEQFLTILRLFNVAASEFVDERSDQTAELQNTLARLGALHLQESTDVLPSERLTSVGDAIRETLVTAESPRLVTAIAPVLIRNIDHINLKKIHIQLADTGLERRLAWIVDNTLEAIRHELPTVSPASWRRLYGRAQVVLGSFLEFITTESHGDFAPDVLDVGIRSKQTLKEVTESSSPISQRWGIVSTLQPDDFVKALKGARAAHQ